MSDKWNNYGKGDGPPEKRQACLEKVRNSLWEGREGPSLKRPETYRLCVETEDGTYSRM